MGICLENFNLPTPDKHNRVTRIPQVIQDEMFDAVQQILKSEDKYKSFNTEQQSAFSMIMQGVSDDDCDKRLFFLNAPVGCGKTFLTDTLLAAV